MWDKVLFPLFRKHSDDEIYKWFDDLQLVDSMFRQGESDLVGSTIRLARRLLGEDQRDCAKGETESAGCSDRARESASRVFAIHKRFSNLCTAKNPSGAVRPWDLERVSNDEIPATKRRKQSMFETMLRDCHSSSRFYSKVGNSRRIAAGPLLATTERY